MPHLVWNFEQGLPLALYEYPVRKSPICQMVFADNLGLCVQKKILVIEKSSAQQHKSTQTRIHKQTYVQSPLPIYTHIQCTRIKSSQPQRQNIERHSTLDKWINNSEMNVRNIEVFFNCFLMELLEHDTKLSKTPFERHFHPSRSPPAACGITYCSCHFKLNIVSLENCQTIYLFS